MPCSRDFDNKNPQSEDELTSFFLIDIAVSIKVINNM